MFNTVFSQLIILYCLTLENLDVLFRVKVVKRCSEIYCFREGSAKALLTLWVNKESYL